MLRFKILALAVVAALGLQTLMPELASAHERRQVGKYNFVVGFMAEPAIEGQPNGVSLRITDAATNEPAEGAEKTLKVNVAFGGNAPKEFALRAVFGQKGAYTTDLIPTRSGTYIFTFTGDIGGQAVNEKFESGPGRFNDVQSPQTLQFPEPVPASSELQRQVTAVERRVADAEQRAAAAVQRADAVQTWAIGAGVLGGLGLLLGLYGLLGGRRRPEAAALVGRAAKAK